MLDAKDLRIGNLFNHFEDGILPIEEIKKDSDGFKGYYAVFRNGSTKCHVSYLTPIELTEEWLLRFGFVDDELQMSGHKWLIYKRPHLHKMDIRIAIPKSDNDWSLTLECVSPPTMTLAHLKYVHQLQNLYYALTNTELTLKDEK